MSGGTTGGSPYTITICGLDELVEHGEVGITHVLSILDPEFPDPEAFGAYGEHERLELRFDDVIEEIAGKLPPTVEHVEAILRFGRDLNAESRPRLLVHCHAGVSRSTAATALLLAQARPDLPASAVMAEVARIRSKAWPNLRIVEMGDALLGRGGSLVEAAHARYAEVAAHNPALVDYMAGVGRGRELARLKP